MTSPYTKEGQMINIKGENKKRVYFKGDRKKAEERVDGMDGSFAAKIQAGLYKLGRLENLRILLLWNEFYLEK
jgi:hypothetical protein